jgi:hypothetical protein
MPGSGEHIRRAVRALEAERSDLLGQVLQIDGKIATLQQLLSDAPQEPSRPRGPGEPAKRGDAEREILEMLRQGRPLTASEIGQRRGTTSNAASNVLRRLYRRGEIGSFGDGRYHSKIAPEGAQGSLAVDAAREEHDQTEGGGS